MPRHPSPTHGLLRKLDWVVLCEGKHGYRRTCHQYEDKCTR